MQHVLKGRHEATTCHGQGDGDGAEQHQRRDCLRAELPPREPGHVAAPACDARALPCDLEPRAMYASTKSSRLVGSIVHAGSTTGPSDRTISVVCRSV